MASDIDKTSTYFDSISSIADNREDEVVSKFWRWKDIQTITDNLDTDPKVIIDLGCGSRPYCAEWIRSARDVWLVDVSELNLKKAKTRVADLKTNANVKFLRVDIRDLLEGFELPEASLVLAMGSSLCYQANTLQKAILIAERCLRSGGIFIGDIWNRYGIAISQSYKHDFPNIAINPLYADTDHILSMIETGVLCEKVNESRHDVYSYRIRDVESMIRDSDRLNVKYVGRKTISLFLPEKLIRSYINSTPSLVSDMENRLAIVPELISVSPKITLIITAE